MELINVVAGIIVKDGKILAVERGHGKFKGSWEFPGGKVEEGETPEQALARELKEELDIEVQDFKFVQTVSNSIVPNFIISFFVCQMKENSTVKLIEHLDSKWVSKNELDSVDWLLTDRMIVDKLKLDYETYVEGH